MTTNRKRLLWQLYPSLMATTLMALLAVLWYARYLVPEYWQQEVQSRLEDQAGMLVEVFPPLLDAGSPEAVDRACKALGSQTAVRISVADPTGRIVGDSAVEVDRFTSQRGLRGFTAALEGRTEAAVQYIDVLDRRELIVYVPIETEGRVAGVLQVGLPVAAIQRPLDAIALRLGTAVIIVGLAVAAVGLGLCRRIARPLEEIRQGAERFARGDLAKKLPVAESQEIGAVAEALNQMAAELDERICALDAERNQRDAILTSMVEGVLAVDADERLISLNRAGADLLGIDRTRSRGRSLQEAVRNVDLQQLVARVLATEQTQVAEITLYDHHTRVLEAHGTVLRATGGQRMGALVVLHNVTQLRRLENVRRDFVANVSHELKTPVTSIKGFVETLLDGAMEDPDDAKRFLGIVASQTDRLTLIIEDLLTLSRVEQEAEKAEIPLGPAAVRPVLDAAVGVLQVKAEKKDIRLVVDCPSDLHAVINPQLLEQAVVNLIDNAVKYSPAGETVEVVGEEVAGEAAVRVRDHGCGIGREHLARVFERFYRVDKARSRKLGGTGLGLAIVKHIAQAHGGRADVESALGKGSTFSVFVKAARE